MDMEQKEKMAKLKETLKTMKASGSGFLCVGTDDPEEAAEIMKMAAELKKPKEEKKPGLGYENLKDAYEYLEGMRPDCDYAKEQLIEAGLKRDSALIGDLDRVYDMLNEVLDKVGDMVEGQRPMKKVKIIETVTFYKTVEVPAEEFENSTVDEYLADHE